MNENNTRIQCKVCHSEFEPDGLSDDGICNDCFDLEIEFPKYDESRSIQYDIESVLRGCQYRRSIRLSDE